jgi:hypothetical protein
MNPVHLMVADFFQCADSAVDAVAAGLGRVAQESRQIAPSFGLCHGGVYALPSVGTIYLNFNPPERPEALHALHRDVVTFLQQVPSAVPDLRSAAENYRPHLPLMQYANLPPPVFADTVEFARAVVEDLHLPQTTRAWKLLLLRFESNAAGDSWDGGRWATDLRWNALASYSL